MAIIELHIYDTNDNLLQSDYNLKNYDLTDNNTLFKIDIHTHLKNRNYNLGQYKYSIRIYETLIDTIHKLKVSKISQDRTELILVPIKSESSDYETFIENIKSNYSNGNGLNFQNDIVVTYVNSKLDETGDELQIIVKLENQLPESIVKNNELFIVNQLGKRIYDKIVFINQNKSYDVNVLSTPNFSIKINDTRPGKGLGYNNYDSIITDNSLSNEILQKYFNTSVDSITLNIDYTDYENFILYSSAENRLLNYKYKLSLLDSYNNSIQTLYDNTSLTIQATTSFINNINKYQTLINETIQSFDGFEKYLYTLYLTSAEFNTYYETELDNAKDFDIHNVHSLVSNVPYHFLVNEDKSDNEQMIKFINLIGHQFDLIWLYIKHLSDLTDRTESIETGLSKYLIKNVLESLGWNVDSNSQLADLIASGSSYTINATDNMIDTQTGTYEIWNRILNNIPLLLKTKGTYESVRSLSNCYGIPNPELMIKEYEGDKLEPLLNRFHYNKFTYGLEFNNNQYVEVPFYGSSTVEFRFKLSNYEDQTIFERSDSQCSINVIHTTDDYGYLNLTFGSDSVNTSEIPIYDFDWYSFMYTFNNTNLNVYVKKNKYHKLITNFTGSFEVTDSSIITESTYYLGKDLTGYLQEFRYWDVVLNESVFDEHVLSPTSYMSNSKFSFYDDLIFRLPLGSETNTYNHSITTQTKSEHPKAHTDNKLVDYYNFENKNNYQLFVDEYTTLIPDIGGQQLTTEKIKIINSFENDRLLDIRNSVLPPKRKRKLNCFRNSSGHVYYGNIGWNGYTPCTLESIEQSGIFFDNEGFTTTQISGSNIFEITNGDETYYQTTTTTLPSVTLEFDDIFTGTTIQLDLNGITYIFEASDSLNTDLYFLVESELSDTLINLKSAIERYGDSNYSVTINSYTIIIKGLERNLGNFNAVIEASSITDAAASGDESGGVGITIQDYSDSIKSNNSIFFVDCDAYGVPDKFEILVGGNSDGPTYVKASSHISDPTVLNGSTPNFDPASDYSIPANPDIEWYIGSNNGIAPTGISEFETDTGFDLPLTSGYQQRIWVTGLNVGDKVYLRVRGSKGTAWEASARTAETSTSVATITQEIETASKNIIFTLYEDQILPTLTIPDSPKLEIGYCPTDEIDFDICESMGNFNIDNILGNYNYDNQYDELKQFKETYYKHYNSGSYNANEYNKLFKFVDDSYFNYIKKSVPSRASLFSGLIVESHILDRRKVSLQNNAPKLKDETLTKTLIVNDNVTSSLHYIDNQRKNIIGNLAGGSISNEKSLVYLQSENIELFYIYLKSENQDDFYVYLQTEKKLNLNE